MTGFTDRVSQGILNPITGKSALFTMPTCTWHCLPRSGLTQGRVHRAHRWRYARVASAAADWNTASGSAPSQISNANTLTFPTATADWGSIIAFGIYDASSTGNLLAWDFFGNYNWLPATVSAASPAVITAKAHGYSVADVVEWSIEYGGGQPTFSTSSFTGQLVVATTATDTFTVTNTATAVNASATGNGMVRKLWHNPLPTVRRRRFRPGALIIRSS
jgi:hypothetical protein